MTFAGTPGVSRLLREEWVPPTRPWNASVSSEETAWPGALRPLCRLRAPEASEGQGAGSVTLHPPGLGRGPPAPLGAGELGAAPCRQAGPLLWRPACLALQGIPRMSAWGPLSPRLAPRLAWQGSRAALLLTVRGEHLAALLRSPFFLSSEVKFK